MASITKHCRRSPQGTVTKISATGKKGGLRKGSLRYSGTKQSPAHQASETSLRIDSDDEDDRKPASRKMSNAAVQHQESSVIAPRNETFEQRMSQPETQRLLGYGGHLSSNLSRGLQVTGRGGGRGTGRGGGIGKLVFDAHNSEANVLRDLQSSVADLQQMMFNMATQHQQQLASLVGYTLPSVAQSYLPQEIDTVNMADPDHFEIVSPPRRGSRKTSLERALVVHHSPPPRESSDTKNTKKSRQSTSPVANRFAALAAEEEDEEMVESSTVNVDSSVKEAEHKIKALSIQQRTEPGTQQTPEGTGQGR